VSRFIDQNRGRFGVELICGTLEVSASAYYQRKSGERSARRIEDERLTVRIAEIHRANYECYGQRRMHAALHRAGESAGRDRVARLMRQAGLRGAKRRGKPWRTTIADPGAQRPADLVRRDFTASAPDRLYVCDFTYLRCWEGREYFSFVIDVFSRRVVGWQLAGQMRTTLVLDAFTDGPRDPSPRRRCRAGASLRCRLAGRAQPVLATACRGGNCRWCKATGVSGALMISEVSGAGATRLSSRRLARGRAGAAIAACAPAETPLSDALVVSDASVRVLSGAVTSVSSLLTGTR
jgi:hypothetical protein